uniref:Uncharacterized protein n=1 Tax=Arundo donax TaxID=35708 RepID=A0A0A9C648_ARUDO
MHNSKHKKCDHDLTVRTTQSSTGSTSIKPKRQHKRDGFSTC